MCKLKVEENEWEDNVIERIHYLKIDLNINLLLKFIREPWCLEHFGVQRIHLKHYMF